MLMALVVSMAAVSRAAEPPSASTNATPPAGTNAPSATTNAPVAPTNTVSVSATNPVALDTNTIPRPPLNAELVEAYRGMRLAKGYQLQLAAADPMVRSPIALAFDANGRLYVAEQPADVTSGRIKLLEDPDGDGSFNTAKVFAGDVPHPTAIACYSGGIFVATGTQVIFLTDTNSDGVADVRREIFGGFEFTNGNVPGNGVNNFTWGLDNRIHAAAAGVGGNITCLAIPSSDTLSLNGYNFAFDPRTLAMAVESEGANRGVSFDNGGRHFICSATRPVQSAVGDPVRAARNPFFIWPELTADLTPANSTPFRMASGILVYRGGALGPSAVDDIYVADPVRRVVSRFHLRDSSLLPLVERVRTDASPEFLISRDPTFRPVQVVSGPDGTLYVADLAREQLDRISEDSGRIWRISPNGLKPQSAPQLAAFKTPDLINVLGSPNAWVRDTAARLLYERRDTNAAPLLARQLARAREPLARLHSLYALNSLGALTERDLIIAMNDGDERIRANAVKLAESFIRNGDVSNALWSRLAATPDDSSLRVRFEGAFTAGLIQRTGAPVVLAEIARSAPAERALQFAVITAAGARAEQVFLDLVDDRDIVRSPAGWQLLLDLAEMTGTQNASGMDQVLTAIERAKLPPLESFALARAVGEGLANSGRTFLSAAPQGTWRGFAIEALNYAGGTMAPDVRAEATRFLGVSGYTSQEVGDWLLALLVPGEPQAVQSAAIASLARFQDPLITVAFLQRWPSLSETSQREIIARMLARFDRTMALLGAIEQRRIPAATLTDVQINFLRYHRDSNIAARALRIYGPSAQTGLAERFAPALQLKGSALRGRDLFLARCASCHRLGSEGNAFGPDLDNVTRQKEKLLQDILEPDREINPDYRTTVVQRTDSQLLSGIATRSGRDVLVVRQPGLTTFVPRTQVEDSFEQEWSLMPQSASAGLSAGDIADLLEFITSGR